jgi:hypothetical protein
LLTLLHLAPPFSAGFAPPLTAPNMLIVDEVHHLLAGTYREQRASLDLLKFLANDLWATKVLVGTRDAVIALQTDSQMVSRFTPFEVPRWRVSEAFRRLLAAFERILPLRRPSDLVEGSRCEWPRAHVTGRVQLLVFPRGHERPCKFMNGPARKRRSPPSCGSDRSRSAAVVHLVESIGLLRHSRG